MWLVFTLVTTIAWGVAEIFYKLGNFEKEKYAHIKTTILVGFMMGLYALIILISQFWVPGNEFNPINIIYYLPVAACYLVSMTCSYFGVRFIDESISDPIENTSGAFVIVLSAVILHESYGALEIIAVVLMVIGIIGLGVFDSKVTIKERIKKMGKKMAVVAFAMPFCYMILDAAGTFLDYYYTESVEQTLLVNVTEDTLEHVANTCYELTFLVVAIVLYIFIRVKGEKLFSLGGASKEDTNLEAETQLDTNGLSAEEIQLNTQGEATLELNESKEIEDTAKDNKVALFFKNTGKTIWVQKYKLIAALCETIGQATYLFALTGSNTENAIAAPILGAGVILISVICSRIFLKEKLNWIQYVFVILIVSGVIMLGVVDGIAEFNA